MGLKLSFSHNRKFEPTNVQEKDLITVLIFQNLQVWKAN